MKLMTGAMMDQPLLVGSLLRHAARFHSTVEVVTQVSPGEYFRYTYSDTYRRALRVSATLDALKIERGERVATLAFNHYRHLELYFGIAASGRVCHTINPRLHIDQIAAIINDADDRVLYFDGQFSSLVVTLKERCPNVSNWIALVDASVPSDVAAFADSYEVLLTAAPDCEDEQVWPRIDERAPAALCYTSGTTGMPKGVPYSHRSIMLHAFAVTFPDVTCLSARDCVMPVVPMFHVNAWGVPWAAPMVGAKLVLPGAHLDGASLTALIQREKVTLAAGVPTIWQSLLNHLDTNHETLPTLTRTLVGGAACPPSMIAAFAERNIETLHAWGMTETSPLGVVCAYNATNAQWPAAERLKLKNSQGRPPFGVDISIVDEDGHPLPHNGEARGELRIRGSWIVQQYAGATHDAAIDGWFFTGDVATIDGDGYMRIVDRVKDLIKSGGEWISSVELENYAQGCPGVAMAAAIAQPHPRWGERPLLIVQPKAGETPDKAAIKAALTASLAKWWLPDDIQFVERIPLTATGKIAKRELREQFKDYQFPDVEHFTNPAHVE